MCLTAGSKNTTVRTKIRFKNHERFKKNTVATPTMVLPSTE
jgi:hypothetical protein